MHNFVNIPLEKQNKIIDAALSSFSNNGYKKTSVSDIANASGISKAMVFNYFGTKKKLYFYLIDLCTGILIDEFNEKFDPSVIDFFDRIKLATNIKLSSMTKHPALLSFLTSMYFEEDSEVKADIKELILKNGHYGTKFALDNIDASRFKEGIDPKLVMKLLVCFAEGYVSQLQNQSEFNVETICREFDECVNLLKNNFYKAEYLI